MDKPRLCGCKGCRTCLLCETEYGISSVKRVELRKENAYVYCPHCDKAWPGWDDYKQHPNHQGVALDFPGVYIQLDFLTVEEERELVEQIDSVPWTLSQSGRRKQNFGPKCNFKKTRLKQGDFKGFPRFSQFVQKKFETVQILDRFQTIEQCFLEYDPERGASIDPHIDDCWIWGERIVTVNLLADSVLTMTKNKDTNRYNLHHVRTYPAVFTDGGECYKLKNFDENEESPVVRIPMPKRSLLVLFNSARYDWEHQILREDIIERRICIAYREFTPPYLPNGEKSEEGEVILAKAKQLIC